MERQYLLAGTTGLLIKRISYFLIALGGIFVVIGTLNLVYTATIYSVNSFPLAFFILVSGLSIFIGGIGFLLFGELIRILMDIEGNTRGTVDPFVPAEIGTTDNEKALVDA